jgi:CHAT domain-containing protein
MPSFSSTETRYVDLRQSRILAMGAKRFKNTALKPLEKTPEELENIKKIWGIDLVNTDFQDENFTVENLKTNLSNDSQLKIVHLSTHGVFAPKPFEDSYIQFSGERLTFAKLKERPNPLYAVELLVLSACETVSDSNSDNNEVELGFAGVAYQIGVKSIIASIWQANQDGTLELMKEFYKYLKTEPTKAEALRQAQLTMINRKDSFSYPYRWAGFTLIGNPW